MQTKPIIKWCALLCALSLACVVQAFCEDSLPTGYKDIQFGMSVDDVKDALKADASFGYRGDRDVSLSKSENQTLIETDAERYAPNSFLTRCWFQFYDDALCTITLNLRRSKIDYHAVFSTLTQKYGEPTSLSPNRAEWRDDNVIMSLEKPLTLKYVDKQVFDDKQSSSKSAKSADEQSKEDFLDGL